MTPPDEARRELVARWLVKAEDDWQLCHRLLKLASTHDPSLAEELSDAPDLTAYAVEYRYPGEYPPVTMDDAARAVGVADRVRDHVRRRLPIGDIGG